VDEQLQWNEMSLRYVKLDRPEYYTPKKFLNQSIINKQKSGEPLAQEEQDEAMFKWIVAETNSTENYQSLLSLGVSKEIARGVLIPAVYTQWHWTASLQALLNFIELREGIGAQSEIGKYATAIETILREYVPVTMKAWDAKQERSRKRRQSLELLEQKYPELLEQLIDIR
jgi:thymidylate synthase (FAD)